ncbi:MAG: hypothetical protein ACNA7K_01210 [Acholeplasmataceae bacterium]
MMKSILLKLAMTLVVLFAAYFGFMLLSTDNNAQEQGHIRLVIVDENDDTVFDGQLIYHEDDTFFDVLNRAFDLTCANGQYQEDPTCTYTFPMIPTNEKVVLNIKGDTFEIKTNWQDTFLAFEYYDGASYRLFSQGVNSLSYTDKSHIRIKVTAVGQTS